MEIIFLGTTAAVPSAARGHSSIALKYHNEVILWDCGEGTQRQLIISKTSYMKIKNIFITHFHGDHFLGLPGLIQTLSFADRREDLHIYAPKGIKDLIENILELGEYGLKYDIVAHSLSNNFELKDEKYTLKSIKVEHSIPTYGLVFEEIKGREFLLDKAKKLGIPPGPMYSKLQNGEKIKLGGRWICPDDVLGEKKKGFKVVYSSDTRPCDAVIENCRDAVLIHDGTFDDSLRDNAVETMHSTCIEAAQVAKEGGARELYLTHISPRYKTDELLLKESRKIFKNTMVARDSQRVELRYKRL